MAKNKKPEERSKKDKQNTPSDQQAGNELQIQEQLAHYAEIAQHLYASSGYQQAEQVIAPISEMPEEDQLILLNALSRERNSDAASVLLAINTLSQQKQVRKEARRALIRLESMNVYSRWTPPALPSLLESLNMITPAPSDKVEVGSEMSFMGADDSPFGDMDDDEEDFEEEEDTVIDAFIEAWAEQRYKEAYDLLTDDSPIRSGLDKDTWTTLRAAWAEQAQPQAVKVVVGYRYETDEELENAPDVEDDSTQELDAFWSLVYQETQLDSSLPELPKATITYPLTGRHWFWTSYTFTKTDDDWRIHHLTDRGAEAQQFSEDELNQRIDDIKIELSDMPIAAMFSALEGTEDEDTVEVDDDIDDDLLDEDEDSEGDDDGDGDGDEHESSVEEQFEEAYWFTLQALHYTDALIAHNPGELNYYEGALARAQAAQDHDRLAAYFPLIAQNIPEQRGLALRAEAATTLTHLRDMIDNDEDEDAINRQIAVVEQLLRESLTVNQEATDYMALALFILEMENEAQFEEADQLLQQALAVASDSEARATVESALADLANTRNNPEEALTHLERAAELAPQLPGIWYKLGEVYNDTNQMHRAEEAFIRSIEVDPEYEDAYAALATIWIQQGKSKEAMRIIEQGLDANPDSVTLRSLMAMQYIEQRNYKKADQLLEEAEELDPDAEIIQIARQVLATIQLQSQQGNSKSNKRKKR